MSGSHRRAHNQAGTLALGFDGVTGADMAYSSRLHHALYRPFVILAPWRPMHWI